MLDELTSYQSFSLAFLISGSLGFVKLFQICLMEYRERLLGATDRWMIILSAGTVIVWLAVLVCLIISCV
jgi:hypothetical protein